MDRRQETIIQALRKACRPMTEGELAAATGLPIGELKSALKAVMSQYRCVLHVTDEGEILYDFGAIRGRSSDIFWATLSRGYDFCVTFIRRAIKLWTAVMLCVYGLFYVMAATILIERFMGGDCRRRSRRLRKELSAFIRGLAIDDVEGAAAAIARPYDTTPPLHERISLAMFGVHDPYRFRGARDRGFLAWAIANKGLVAASDWMRLFGTSLDEAEREVLRIYADYGADVFVGESGSIIYDFRFMLATGKGVAWEKPPESPEPWAARETKRRYLMTRHAAFGHVLGFSSLMLLGSAGMAFMLGHELLDSIAAWTLMVWIPGSFAFCVLATTLYNAFRMILSHWHNRERVDLYGRIFWDGGLGVEARAASAGIDLERIRRELTDLSDLRQKCREYRELGKVIFSSDSLEKK